jgi:hypothetical protein
MELKCNRLIFNHFSFLFFELKFLMGYSVEMQASTACMPLGMHPKIKAIIHQTEGCVRKCIEMHS